jgi:hypothetical protein
MNLSASTLKRDLVHRQFHQVDTATVIGFQSLDRQRVGNRIVIKPLPSVCDDNGHSLSQLTSTANPNQLVGVRPIAVNDCIAQSFPKRQFNGALISGNAARSFDQSHQPVCQWRDGSDFTRHPGLDLEQGMTRTSQGRPQPQIRTSVRGLSLSHRTHLTLSHVPAKSHGARNQILQTLC